jgi:hypothetical protein
MGPTRAELHETYGGWTDEELLGRFQPDALTPEAREVMEQEIGRRGLTVPKTAVVESAPGEMPVMPVSISAERISKADQLLLQQLLQGPPAERMPPRYIDAATLDYLARSGATPSFVAMLRELLGDAEGIDLTVIAQPQSQPPPPPIPRPPPPPVPGVGKQPGRRPVLHPSTAWFFIAAFVLFSWILGSWYEPGIVWHDPFTMFEWLAVSYLMAFAATELFRQRSLHSASLCIAAALLFAGNYSRHAAVMLQKTPGYSLYAPVHEAFAPYPCMFGQDHSFLSCLSVTLVNMQIWLIAIYLAVLSAGVAAFIMRRRKARRPT